MSLSDALLSTITIVFNPRGVRPAIRVFESRPSGIIVTPSVTAQGKLARGSRISHGVGEIGYLLLDSLALIPSR